MIEGHRDRVLLRTTPAGLILTGGGARAAYQVGVLKGIAAVLRDTRLGLDPGIAQGHNPFQILVGTSAGAINAAALACRADNFQESVALLVQVWENFHAEQVYRSDVLGVVRSGARWLMLLSLGWMVRRSLRLRPRSLLDSAPLAALLVDTQQRRSVVGEAGEEHQHRHQRVGLGRPDLAAVDEEQRKGDGVEQAAADHQVGSGSEEPRLRALRGGTRLVHA